MVQKKTADKDTGKGSRTDKADKLDKTDSSEAPEAHEPKLTEKQAAVLAVIGKEIARTGRPPTFRGIADALGYDAVGTVQDHVAALVRKGFLEKELGVSRGFRLIHQSTSVSIPILGVVPAGRPIEAIEDIQGSLAISVPGRRANATSQEELFALKVKGDSMVEEGIFEGDFVIVRKQRMADHGDIVVAMIDGEATVKTLEKKSGRIRLLPANHRYAPIDISLRDGAYPDDLIAGKVISIQRFYS